jgi:hypothetical protein
MGLFSFACSLVAIGKPAKPMSALRNVRRDMVFLPGLFASLTLRADLQSFNALRAFVRPSSEYCLESFDSTG